MKHLLRHLSTLRTRQPAADTVSMAHPARKLWSRVSAIARHAEPDTGSPFHDGARPVDAALPPSSAQALLP